MILPPSPSPVFHYLLVHLLSSGVDRGFVSEISFSFSRYITFGFVCMYVYSVLFYPNLRCRCLSFHLILGGFPLLATPGIRLVHQCPPTIMQCMHRCRYHYPFLYRFMRSDSERTTGVRDVGDDDDVAVGVCYCPVLGTTHIFDRIANWSLPLPSLPSPCTVSSLLRSATCPHTHPSMTLTSRSTSCI